MTRDRNHPDPMTARAFDGMSGSPAAGMPEPPPIPGEGGRSARMIGAAITIVILLAILAVIIL